MSQPSEPAADAPRQERLTATVEMPQRMCPYTGLVAHARGGLGEVFRCTDPALHRTVAVKRLQERLADQPDSRRRFLLEAEITARLEHPGVVPVYGLFQEEGNRPAYAMRFVEGLTLWDAIQAYHAGPPDPVAFRRLLLAFLQVCQTVAYAHSRGVIHRDLKPQNVMLGKFGETLVVDWGLAKVVGRPEEAKRGPAVEGTLVPESGSGDETAMGSAVGTPAYMSPEQAAGRWNVIDQRSDVYGLGAVLYTLLAGKPPLAKGDWPEMQQKIQRGDFPRPRQVKPAAPKPLEAVCLKALALRPEDRYPSASALAGEIEHWLADEPVAAYREPVLARGRRWMRRHRTLVTAAALALVTALAAAGAGLVLLGQKNQQIAAERNAARTAADEAEAVNAFLTDDLLGQADPDANDRQKKVSVEELLHRAARRIDANARFANRPAVEATLRLTIGKTFFHLGNLPEAERHLERAVELRRQAFGPDDPRTLASQEALADFLNRGPARFAKSVPLARQTWQARAGVLGPTDRDTLDSLDTYACALYGSGRVAEATARHRECLAARRRVLGSDHPDTLTSMNNLGVALFEQGEWESAIPLLREVVDIRGRRRQGAEYSMAVCNLATALYLKGDLEEADRLLQVNVERSTKRFGPDHPLTDRSRGLQVRVWTDQGRVEAAVSQAKQVVQCRRRIYGGDHTMTGTALLDLGRGLVLLGHHAEAKDALEEARKIYAKAPTHARYFLAWAQCWHGASLTGLRRYEEAEPLLLGAEQQLRDMRGPPPRHYRQAVEQIVSLYGAWGRPKEAATWRKKLETVK